MPLRRPRAAALIFIFATVVLDMLAVGMIVPVLPKLVVGFLGGDTVVGARVYGLFGTAWAVMQFFFSPILGALSDRFGRRPVLLLSTLGLGLDYVLMALAPSLEWLLVGRMISGITAATFSTAGAYIADILPAERRAAGFGMIGAAFSIGFVLGPALGGVLGVYNPRLPFWVAGALSLLNVAYGYFVLPESLPVAKRAAFSWRRANPVGSLRLLRASRELIALAVVYFLHRLAHDVLPSTFVLYTTYRYGWTERDVGWCLAAMGVLGGIVSGGLIGPVVTRFGERAVLLGALCCGVGSFALSGSAATPLLLWLALPLQALWGMTSAALQGLMTRHVGGTEQGQLQGALSSLMGIAGLVGPGLFTMTFARFIDPQRAFHLPGAAFYLAASLLVAAALVAWRAATASVAPLRAVA